MPLDDFTWENEIPYDKYDITYLFTGTYNEDLDYDVYYKTNKSDYKKIGIYNTKTVNRIDFTNLKLDKDEYISDYKFTFHTVKVGFKSIEEPFIFGRVRSFVKDDDTFTDNTRIYGYYDCEKRVEGYNVLLLKDDYIEYGTDLDKRMNYNKSVLEVKNHLFEKFKLDKNKIVKKERIIVEDTDTWTTKVYKKTLDIKRLPKAGQ